MLADAQRWPLLLPTYVHVERIDFDGTREQLRVWDVVAEQVRSFEVRRVLDPVNRTVEFEQRDALWPGETVVGRWSVVPQDGDRSLVTLSCERPWTDAALLGADDGPLGAAAETRARLAEVQRMAERWRELDELLLSFEDRVHVQGPAELVYDFLYRVQDWAELVPHVEWTSVTEDQPGIQLATMGSCAAPDGAGDLSEAVRLCFPHAGRIVFKESVTPRLLAAHTGEWSLLPDEHGVTVVAAHQVMLHAADVEAVLGAGAEPVDARRQVREWLGRAGTELLELAKWHAESAVRRLR
jgi:aromatase